MQPCISIIVPSYQGGLFLEQAIQSILSQEYPAIELIVIDGGSTDNSLEILQKYEKSLAFWVSELDQGQSDAINKGFARATGEIVTFLSSDDTYAPGAFAHVAVQFAQQPQTGAVIGAFQFQDEASRLVSEPVFPRLESPSPCDLTLLDPATYRLHQIATFYSRRTLEQAGFWVRKDLHYVMDRELLYRVCAAFPLVLTNQVYGWFRKHALSKSEHAILPFAEEFASLYLQSMDGNAQKDYLRARHARYLRASGWLKFARATRQSGPAISALLRALFIWPGFLFHYSYISAWRRVLTA